MQPTNCMQDEVRNRVLRFRHCTAFEDGMLVVQPVTAEWIEASAELLTESFAESMGYITIYKNFLRRQIREYLRTHMMLPPKAVVLIAVFKAGGREGGEGSTGPSDAARLPGDESTDEDADDGMAVHPDLLQCSSSSGSSGRSNVDGSGKDGSPFSVGKHEGMLVGVVEVSYSASTRSKFPTLNSPEVSQCVWDGCAWDAGQLHFCILDILGCFNPPGNRLQGTNVCSHFPFSSQEENPTFAGPSISLQHVYLSRAPGQGLWPGFAEGS